MAAFEKWLATSPLASFLKIALAAALGAVGSYLATSSVDPLWVAVSAAVIPVAINWLNKEDPRYGLNKAE